MAKAQHRSRDSKQDYRTPVEFLDATKRYLGIEDFDCDLAASHENAVTPCYYTKEDNALIQPWTVGDGWNWLNPEFKHIKPWVERALFQSQLGAQTCMLVPAGVGSNWFGTYAFQKCYVVLLNGRLTFVGEPDPYPKDLMLLLYSQQVPPGWDFWSWKT